MIESFIQKYQAAEPRLRERLAEAHPSGYSELVQMVVEAINPDSEHDWPDPNRIHQIDDGDYQGTILYVVAEVGYQPSTYWATAVSYGSCSGCDTFEAIRGYSGDAPTPDQVNEYLTLALHLVQGFRRIAGYGTD